MSLRTDGGGGEGEGGGGEIVPDNDPRAIALRTCIPKPAPSTAPVQSNIRNLHGGGGATQPRPTPSGMRGTQRRGQSRTFFYADAASMSFFPFLSFPELQIRCSMHAPGQVSILDWFKFKFKFSTCT